MGWHTIGEKIDRHAVIDLTQIRYRYFLVCVGGKDSLSHVRLSHNTFDNKFDEFENNNRILLYHGQPVIVRFKSSNSNHETYIIITSNGITWCNEVNLRFVE